MEFSLKRTKGLSVEEKNERIIWGAIPAKIIVIVLLGIPLLLLGIALILLGMTFNY